MVAEKILVLPWYDYSYSVRSIQAGLAKSHGNAYAVKLQGLNRALALQAAQQRAKAAHVTSPFYITLDVPGLPRVFGPTSAVAGVVPPPHESTNPVAKTIGEGVEAVATPPGAGWIVVAVVAVGFFLLRGR